MLYEFIFKGTDELQLSILRKLTAKVFPSLLVILKKQANVKSAQRRKNAQRGKRQICL